jgi:hypothetical protein
MPNTHTFADMNQEAPSALFSNLIQAWGYGSLGNLQGQRIAAADEPFPTEIAAQEHLHFNTLFQSASPRSRLRTLKAMQFTAANKEERVQRSLAALNEPLGINLSAAQWAMVSELTEEDEE